MHLAPTEGQARTVAKPFVDMRFAPALNTTVPISVVTGTNGKTTAAKPIAHTLMSSGHMVGFAATTGFAMGIDPRPAEPANLDWRFAFLPARSPPNPP